MISFTRRGFLATGSTLALGVPFHKQAMAADFRLKLSLNTPQTHPVSIRSVEAAERISAQTNGRVQIDVFANSQLGGDTHALSQLRSGGIEMQAMSGGILENLVRGTTIYNTPMAFANYDKVWEAMDGDLGRAVNKLVDTAGLHAHPKVWDNGFRHCTSSTRPINRPVDFKGMKFRVAPSPATVMIFKAFGATTVTINIAETYNALQTHAVDGQENGLALIDTLKFDEVQKYCALTNHMWDGFLLLFNGKYWNRLPPDIQQIITKNFDQAIMQQRQDMIALNKTLQAKLEGRGMIFSTPERPQFRDALVSAGFYQEWKERFDKDLWAGLEKYTGPLV